MRSRIRKLQTKVIAADYLMEIEELITAFQSEMFYRPRRLMSIGLMFLAFNVVHAQEKNLNTSLLSGIVLDKETKQPIPYVNMVIEGSNVGTSSSEAGIFYLGLNTDKLEYLRISSIGYLTMRLRIDSLLSIKSLEIFLKPSVINLDEVVIHSSEVSASDFVREAIQSLGENTYRKDYSLEWYSTMVSTDSARKVNYCLETVFDDYHIEGKTRQVIRQQRESGISPILVEDQKDTKCTLMPWFDLGLAQIENAEYGVFNLKNINDFVFTYEGVRGLDNDSVYVIGYQAIKPRYETTGATNKKIKYGGKLYITTESHAIVRHTLESSEKRFRNDEVLYKKIGDYYFPYYIKSTRNLNISKTFKPLHTNVYILRNVRLDNVQYKPGYNWCDNRAPYNKDFWSSNYPRKQ